MRALRNKPPRRFDGTAILRASGRRHAVSHAQRHAAAAATPTIRMRIRFDAIDTPFTALSRTYMARLRRRRRLMPMKAGRRIARDMRPVEGRPTGRPEKEYSMPFYIDTPQAYHACAEDTRRHISEAISPPAIHFWALDDSFEHRRRR